MYKLLFFIYDEPTNHFDYGKIKCHKWVRVEKKKLKRKIMTLELF